MERGYAMSAMAALQFELHDEEGYNHSSTYKASSNITMKSTLDPHKILDQGFLQLIIVAWF
jgi:hypothetical protein